MPRNDRHRCFLSDLAGFTVPNHGDPTITAAHARGDGGEGGVRTRGTFRYTRFPVVHLRPLGHLSKRMAERVGFEPTVSCPTIDFESIAFDHSATFPQNQADPFRLRSDAKKLFSWAEASSRHTPLDTAKR